MTEIHCFKNNGYLPSHSNRKTLLGAVLVATVLPTLEERRDKEGRGRRKKEAEKGRKGTAHDLTGMKDRTDLLVTLLKQPNQVCALLGRRSVEMRLLQVACQQDDL